MKYGYFSYFSVILTAFITILKKHNITLTSEEQALLVSVVSNQVYQSKDKSSQLIRFLKLIKLTNIQKKQLLKDIQLEPFPPYFEKSIKTLIY